MSTQSQAELQAFYGFLSEQLNGGQVDLSPEESVELWRSVQREQAEANEGIRRGLEDARAGRIRPAEEFLAEFRQQNGLSDDS